MLVAQELKLKLWGDSYLDLKPKRLTPTRYKVFCMNLMLH